MKRPSSGPEKGSASALGSDSGASAPALDLDVLMARLREEVRAKKRVTAPAAVDEPKRVRARDLLDLPEAAFVMKAYRVVLGREADPDEAGREIDRLLLGKLRRTQLLGELLATEEARAVGARLDGLPQARVRERLMSSPVASLFLTAADGLRTVYMLPKRIRQFVKRVEALEQRASEQTRRIETLEQEVLGLRTAHQGDGANAPGEPQPVLEPASLSGRRRSDAR
jgi:hypothetical protein